MEIDMNKNKSGFWNSGIWGWLIAIVVLLTYLILSIVGLASCPMRYVFGITCPGCGVTRAFVTAFSGDLSTAFFYHPLWPAFPVVIILMIVFHFKKMQKAFDITGLVACGVAIAVYLYRLLFTDSFVVAWNIDGCLISRWISELSAVIMK